MQNHVAGRQGGQLGQAGRVRRESAILPGRSGQEGDEGERPPHAQILQPSHGAQAKGQAVARVAVCRHELVLVPDAVLDVAQRQLPASWRAAVLSEGGLGGGGGGGINVAGVVVFQV